MSSSYNIEGRPQLAYVLHTTMKKDLLRTQLLKLPVFVVYLEVATHEADETRALHAPQGLHLLEQLRSLLPVEHAEHLDRVQLSRLHVLRT